MPMMKVHPKAHGIINKLCPYDIFDRSTLLYPLHHCRQHVVRTLKRDSRSLRCAALADDPASWAGIAMEHAWDAEEAEKLI